MKPLHRLTRPVLLLGLGVLVAGFNSIEALFAPSSELWPRWQAHDPASSERIDHTAWDGLLQAHLQRAPDGINRFAYGSVGAEDREALAGYIDGLTSQPISAYNRSEQFAYWINLYNALTVQVVLDHYPVDGIRDIDISPGLFADGPWDAELVTVEGEALTLNDIEHRILRPIWQDPRIHYAVNCAALGCPNLQDRAFTGDNSDALLDAAARAYVNHPRGAVVNADGLLVSSIYIWFAEDFGQDDSAIIEHLWRYAEGELATGLAQTKEIDDHAYDWSLNDAEG